MENLKKVLNEYGQTHLLDFANELNDTAKKQLTNDIQNIDFKLMKNLYTLACDEIKQEAYTVSELDKVYIKDELEQELVTKWSDIGRSAIKSNKFAVVTMAGRARHKAWI